MSHEWYDMTETDWDTSVNNCWMTEWGWMQENERSYLSFLRGHGTFVDNEKILASVTGTVEVVNKLISVKPLKTR